MQLSLIEIISLSINLIFLITILIYLFRPRHISIEFSQIELTCALYVLESVLERSTSDYQRKLDNIAKDNNLDVNSPINSIKNYEKEKALLNNSTIKHTFSLMSKQTLDTLLKYYSTEGLVSLVMKNFK